MHGLASIGESVSGHAPVAPYIPITVGLAGLAAFVLRQVRMQRRGAAFLDVRIFATKPFTVPLLAVALVAFGSQIVLPLVLTGAYLVMNAGQAMVWPTPSRVGAFSYDDGAGVGELDDALMAGSWCAVGDGGVGLGFSL